MDSVNCIQGQLGSDYRRISLICRLPAGSEIVIDVIAR